MSLTPAPDLGPPPCGGRRVKQGARGGGEEGPGAGAVSQASKAVRDARCRGRGSPLCHGHGATEASGHGDTGLSRASLQLSLRVLSTGGHMLMAPPAKKGEEKQMKAGLEAWRPRSPAALPATKGQRQTSGAWRGASGLSSVVASGKPRRANKYYLQTGRRSRGGGTMGLWGHRLWRSPTSNKTG